MATECTREAIHGFMAERGGRVKHAELIRHFGPALPDDPPRRTAAREAFKAHVDSMACVRLENGVKFVCLKKQYRVRCDAGPGDPVSACLGGDDDDPPLTEDSARPPEETLLQPSPGVLQRGSGYGNDSQVNPHLPSEPEEGAPVLPCTPTDDEEVFTNGEIEMGTRWSSHREEQTVSIEKCTPESAAGEHGTAARVSSPLPPFSDGSVFAVKAGREPGSPAPDAAAESRDRNRSMAARQDDSPEAGAHGNASPHPHPRIQGDLPSPTDTDEGASEGGGSPAGRPGRQPSAGAPPGDGDAVSLASSCGEEEAPAVALDPLEHEWMLCASDGEWDSLQRLLGGEPALLLRRDFVTGFTCLHWAAKHGKPELLALALDFARRRGVPLDVNSRSSAGGYTPLHLAAMHGRGEALKLLVGACDADTEVRDYSGRRAAQYLGAAAARDLRDIMEPGAAGSGLSPAADEPGAGRGWRFSKVLQPLRLLGPNEGGAGGGGEDQGSRESPLRRMSSLSRVKPRLQKLRDRTSQMVHSASFREAGEPGGAQPRVRRKSGLTPADLVTLRGGAAD